MRKLLILTIAIILGPVASFGQTSYEEKADQYRELGNYNDAIVYYTLALDGLTAEERLDIVDKRAISYQNNDNQTSALVDYSEIVEFYRKNPERLKFMTSKSRDDWVDFQFDFMNPLFFKATCLFFLERTEEALNELTQYIELSEFNYRGMLYLDALEYRGLCRAQNRDMVGACSDWNNAAQEGSKKCDELWKKHCGN